MPVRDMRFVMRQDGGLSKRADVSQPNALSHAAVQKDDMATPGAADDAFAEAMGLFKSRRFLEAERVCLQILARRPNSASAIELLGLTCQSIGRYEEAAVHMRRSVDLCPQNAELHNNLGNVLG